MADAEKSDPLMTQQPVETTFHRLSGAATRENKPLQGDVRSERQPC